MLLVFFARLSLIQSFSYFLIRQMLQVAGESYVKDLINTPFNFLVPRNIQDALASFAVPDMFGMFDDNQYKSAKDKIDDIVGQSDTEEGVTKAIQNYVEVTFCHVF